MKDVEFLGSSLDELRQFPLGSRRAIGHQIDRVQQGLDPDDWKPMPSIGSGAGDTDTGRGRGMANYLSGQAA